MSKEKEVKMCQCCEEQQAAIRLDLTDLDGILFDTMLLCAKCAPGVSVMKDCKNLSY